MFNSLWGRITGKDAGKTFPQQQGKSLDRLGDLAVIFPWGMYSNLPDGKLFKVVDGDGKAVIGVTVERPPGVEQGEVSFWHPGTGSVIHFKNNGDLNIDTVVDGAGDVNINTTTANVTASADVNVSCLNSVVTSTVGMTIDTPLATFTTNVLINGTLTVVGLTSLGNLTVAGTTGLGSTVTSGTKNISDTHTHGDPPTTGVPSP